MALINCKECGKEISTNAEVCPHCGNPNTLTEEEKQKALQDKKANNIIIIVCVVLFSIIGIYLFSILFGAFDELGDIVDNEIDSYIEQKERDDKLKKDIYKILKD